MYSLGNTSEIGTPGRAGHSWFLGRGRFLVSSLTYDYDTYEQPDPTVSTKVRYDDKSNEEGFLGLAFHPDYKRTGEFFVFYTERTPGHNNVLSRFRVSKDDPDRADPGSEPDGHDQRPGQACEHRRPAGECEREGNEAGGSARL